MTQALGGVGAIDQLLAGKQFCSGSLQAANN